MIWPRLRTWIGMHPLWAVVLATVATLSAVVAFALSADTLLVSWIRLSHSQIGWLLGVGVPPLVFGAAGAASAFVTLVLERACLPSRRILLVALASPFFVALALAAFVAGACIIERFERGSWGTIEFNWGTIFVGGLLVTVSLSLGNLTGWALAAHIARRRRRAGLWETVHPATPEGRP